MKKSIFVILILFLLAVSACSRSAEEAKNQQQNTEAKAMPAAVAFSSNAGFQSAVMPQPAFIAEPALHPEQAASGQPNVALIKLAADNQSQPTTDLSPLGFMQPEQAGASLARYMRPAAGGSSTGDSLNREPEPLPFNDTPYTHPSGAFTFGVPQSWEMTSEDESGTVFGDDESAVMGAFVDAGQVFNDRQMQEFIVTVIENMFGEDYKIIEQNVQPDDSIYVAIRFKSGRQSGDGDYFFEQRETVLFVLYFGTFNYDEMLPTWQAIIDSYSVDPQAVLAGSAPAPQPTPRPFSRPTPTPAPEINPFAPQTGRSRLYVFNEFNQDLTFTVNNSEHKIPVGAEVPIDLDAGRYTYTISIPGGAVNGEVTMAPNQSWAVGVRGDGAVYEPFQVYP